MNIGDLVVPKGMNPEEITGIVLSEPLMHQGGLCVFVNWVSWNQREYYALDYLEVVSGTDK